jgi:hypothetical protein
VRRHLVDVDQQRRCEGVPREDVEVLADHERRCVDQLVEEPLDLGSHRVRAALRRRAPIGPPREALDVGALVEGEAQRVGDGVEDGLSRPCSIRV